MGLRPRYPCSSVHPLRQRTRVPFEDSLRTFLCEQGGRNPATMAIGTPLLLVRLCYWTVVPVPVSGVSETEANRPWTMCGITSMAMPDMAMVQARKTKSLKR